MIKNMGIRVDALEKRLSSIEELLQNATRPKKVPAAHSDPKEPDLTFYLDGEPILVFKKSGKIVHKGKLIGRDVEVIEGIRSFLLSQGYIKNPNTPVN